MRYIWLLLLWYFIPFLTFAQSLQRAEYFFDNDPGYGNATSISLNNLENETLLFNAPINDLEIGLHTFYLRILGDSGRWSQTYNKVVLVETFSLKDSIPIQKAEYYFDEDPGFGKGVSINGATSTKTNIPFVADLTALSEGLHNLYIRAMNANGIWSTTFSKSFLIDRVGSDEIKKITRLEYFINEDPGYGKATAIPLSDELENGIPFTIPLDDQIPGFKTLHVRAMDEGGNWSTTHTRSFLVESFDNSLTEIDLIEYFFNQDPGFGNGVRITSNDLDFNYIADLNDLDAGRHQLFVRARNTEGQWSTTLNRPFLLHTVPSVAPNITKLEYFINQDPGYGNGIDVPFSPSKSLEHTFIADLSALDSGSNTLYIRAKNDLGAWSNVHLSTFEIGDLPEISGFNPTSGVPGDTITINGFNFSLLTEENLVKFNNVPVEVSAATTTQLEVKVPTSFFGPVDVSVTVNDISVTASQKFQIVRQKPIITSIEPATAVVGDIVTINGDHFGLDPADIQVAIGGKQAEIIGTDGQSIQFKVPDGIGGLLELSVSVSNISVDQPVSFTVNAPASNRPPQITSSPVVTACLNVDLAVTADIVDQTNRITQAILFYREIGSEEWSQTSLRQTTGDTYSAVIPALFITDAGTEYYIEAKDDYQVSSATPVTTITKLDEPLLSRPATNLTPEDGIVNLDIPIRFTWMGSPEALSYDFYLWPSNEAKPTNPTAANISEMVYIFNNRTIQYGQPYSWQVISKDACTSLPSEIQEITFRNLPDLTVTSVTLPTSALSEDQIEVQWEIENVGNGATGNAIWSDYLYLSREPVLNLATADFIKGISRARALDAGEAYNQTSTIELPRGVNGEFYLFVVTNRNNHLLETDINNNSNYNLTPLQVALRPTPDLAIEPVVVSPRNTFSEQKIAVQWEVKNIGTVKTETAFWYDEIYLSQNEEFVLNQARLLKRITVQEILEPGNNYIKTDSITLPRGIDGKYFIYIHSNRQEHIFEPQGNNISRSDSLDVRLLPPPDLVVSKIEIRETASNNESISVYWEVENQGPGAIEDSRWVDGLFLSTQQDGSAQMIPLGNFAYQGNVAPGATYQQQASIVIPKSLNGPYYLLVKTDISNQVYEYIYDDNNQLGSDDPIVIMVPDLRVADVQAPDTGFSGQALNVSWEIENAGEGAVINQRWRETVYLSKSRELTFDAVDLGSINVQNSIIKGGSVSRSFVANIPDGIEGTFYIIVISDQFNQIYEDGKKNNNTLASTEPTEIALSPFVDLNVASVEIPGFSLAGMPLEINYSVLNQGNKDAEGTVWTDRIYISLDSVWNQNSAHFLTEINRSQGLAIDATYSVQTQVELPLLSRFGPDVHDANGYIYVFSDAHDAVYEFTEKENNVGRSEAIYLTNPTPVNLKMEAVSSGKRKLKSGEPLTVNWSVSNTGNATSVWNSGAWYDGIFLSADSIWDDQDVYVAQQRINEPVSEGGNYENSLSFRLPNGVFGELYLLVVADFRNLNNDANLSDNFRYVQVLNEQGEPVDQLPFSIDLSASPDLVVENFESPILAVSGQPITVHWEVSNQGDSVTTANSWSDRFYLSTNFIIDSGDQRIGSRVQERALGVGEIYKDSIELMIPSNAEGNYVLLLRADDSNTMYEHNGKTNNVVFRQTLVSRADPSDLIIHTISSPDTIVAGDPVTISYQIQNIGENIASGVSSEGIYFSPDSLLDVTDIRLGVVGRSIRLGPMADTSRGLTAYANNLTPGSYYLLVQADIKNNITETDKENNLGLRLGKVEVVVPQLEFGVERIDSLANDLRKYYRIHVPDSMAKETLLVELKGSEDAINTMYLKHGEVPGPVNYDQKFGNPLSGNQEIVVEEMVAGDYYILVTGQDKVASGQTIGIKASIVPFELRTVDSSVGGNSGMVTVKLEGAKFSRDMVVSLERSGGESVRAARLEWKNSILAYATFDLNGVPVGVYDVNLTKPDGNTAIRENGFEVVPGIIKGLAVRAGLDNGSGAQSVTKAFVCCDRELNFDGVSAIGDYLPANTRPNRVVSMTFYIENTSNVDIPVVQRYLVSMDGAPLGYTVSELGENKQEVYLEFRETDGPEHILRPGARSEIIVYSRAVLPLRFKMIE